MLPSILPDAMANHLRIAANIRFDRDQAAIRLALFARFSCQMSCSRYFVFQGSLQSESVV